MFFNIYLLSEFLKNVELIVCLYEIVIRVFYWNYIFKWFTVYGDCIFKWFMVWCQDKKIIKIKQKIKKLKEVENIEKELCLVLK